MICPVCHGDVSPNLRNSGVPKVYCGAPCKRRQQTIQRGERERLDPALAEAHRADSKARYWADPASRAADGVLRRYGLTADGYARMLDQQGGVCAICRQPETTSLNGTLKRLAVDHDHATGAIRGLLCSRCNLMIGKANDDVTLLMSAIEYLSRRRAK